MTIQTEITTCQICGRAIKSKSGLVAHHGYRRPGHGWQTASCPGAKYEPYEVSCERLAEIIGDVKKFIVRQEQELVNHISNPPARIMVMERRSSLSQGRAVLYEKPDDFARGQYGSSIPHTYRNAYRDREDEYEQKISAAKSDLVVMERRLAEWKAPVK